MRRALNGVLSIVLTMALMVGLTAGFPASVYAAEGPVPASEGGDSSPASEPEAPAGEPEAPPENPDSPSEPAGPPEDGGEDGEDAADEDVDVADDPEAEEEAPGDDGEAALLPAYDETEYEVFDSAGAVADAQGLDNGNIFDGLGIATKPTTPDGIKEQQTRSTLKPYGDRHTMTVNEVFTLGRRSTGEHLSPRLYGHSTSAQGSLSNQTNTAGTPAGLNWLNAAYLDDAATWEGDFEGNGRKDQYAILIHRSFYSIQNKFELWVADVAADAASSTTSTEPNIGVKIGDFGLPGSYPKGSLLAMDTAEYDLHVRTGDLNGDGIDEVIALVSNYGDISGKTVQLVVYALKENASWRTANSWTKVYDTPIDIPFGTETGSVSIDGHTLGYIEHRTHALAVGDLDGDGMDDIAVTSSKVRSIDNTTSTPDEYYSTKDQAAANLYLLFGGSSNIDTAKSKHYTYDSTVPSGSTLFGGTGALLEEPTIDKLNFTKEDKKELTGTFPGSHVLPNRLGVDIVDAGGGSGNELLLGYTLHVVATPSFGLTDTSDRGYYPNVGYGAGVLYHDNETRTLARESAFTVMYTDIVAGHKESTGNDLYFCGNQLTTIAATGFTILGGLIPFQPAVPITAAQMQGPGVQPSIIVGSNRHDWVASNDKDNYQLWFDTATKGFQYNYFPMHNFTTSRYSEYTYLKVRPGLMSATTKDGSAPKYGYLIQFVYRRSNSDTYEHRAEFVSGNTMPAGSPTGSNDDLLNTGYTLGDGLAAACLPDTDNDSIQLEFKNYEYLYTDPTVLAVLAAAPYFRDVALTGGTNYTDDFTTAYSMYTAVSNSTTQSKSTSLGGYVAVEAEIGCLFASAVVETEVSIDKTWTEEFEEALEHSVEELFEVAGEDCVIMLSYPMDSFTYTMTYPSDETGENTETCAYTVTIPYRPSYNKLSLEQYNKVYQRYPDDLPDLASEVFTHEPGYPFTYPSSSKGYSSPFVSPTPANTAIDVSVATTNTLGVTKTNTTTTTTTNTVSVKAGAGAKAGISNSSAQVTAGVNFSDAGTDGKILTNTSGVSYAGKIGVTGDNPAYGFQWQLMQYNYYGKQNFPVVTYIVTPNSVLSPVYLPDEYGINDALTTHNQVAIEWTPSRSDRNPGAYSDISYCVTRVVDSSGKNDFEIKGTPTYDPITGTYTLIDTLEIAPSTQYTYTLSAGRKGVSGWSYPTEPFSTFTNPGDYKIYFSENPQDTTLRPGGETKLSATLHTDDAPYRVTYAWQHYAVPKNGSKLQWYNLQDGDEYSGTDTPELTLRSASSGLEGPYRLLARMFLGGNIVKTFSSDECTVSFSKFQPDITFVQLPAGLGTMDTETTISAKVVRDSSEGLLTDSPMGGTVQFTLTRPTGSMEIYTSKEIGSDGLATATFEVPRNGIYTIEARYSGDKLFVPSGIITASFGKNAEDIKPYIRATADRATCEYGEEIQFSVTKYAGGDSGVPAPNPAVRVDKYELNPDGTTTMRRIVTAYSSTAGKASVAIKETGQFRATIFSPGVTGSVTKDFTVTKRPVTYTAKSVTRYLPHQVPSAADLQIELTGGSLVFYDAAHYTGASLALFDKAGKEVPLTADIPAGIYTIQPKTTVESDNYNIKVEPALYTVVDGADGVTLHHGLAAGSEGRGTLRVTQPADHESGDLVAKGLTVSLRATPEPGYAVDTWTVTESGKAAATRSGGSIYAIENIKADHIVTVSFKPADPPVSRVSLSPSLCTVLRGHQKLFELTVEGGTTKTVQWALEGAKSEDTTLSEGGLLTVAEDETAATLTVVATSLENKDKGARAIVTVEDTKISAVSLTGRGASTIPSGGYRQFSALVEATGGASEKVHWTVSGGRSEDTRITAGGLLHVGADEAAGTSLLVRAAAEEDDQKYDQQTLLVTDPSLGSSLAFGQTHVTLSPAADAILTVPLLHSAHLSLAAPEVYQVLTNRTEVISGKLIAVLNAKRDAVILKADGAISGEVYVVRLTVRPGVWAECRVDIGDELVPADPHEFRTTAKEVTAYAYSTAAVVVPVQRVVNRDRKIWDVTDARYVVRLAATNDSVLLDAFNSVLVPLDEGRLELVPKSPTTLATLKKTTFKKVQLELFLKNGTSEELVPGGIFTTTFTLKVNKKLPTVKAQPITLDTWSGADAASPVFTGGTVTALSALPAKVDGWLKSASNGLLFSAAKGAKGSATLKLKATLEGWTQPVNVSIKVTATNAAPGLKLKSGTAKLYQTGSLCTGAELTLLPKRKTDTLESLGVASVAVAPAYAGTYTVSRALDENGTFTLSARGNPGNETIQLRVTFGGARAGRFLDLPVTVRVAKNAIKLKPAKTAITLNTTLQESYTLALASTVSTINLDRLYLTLAPKDGQNPANLAEPVLAADHRSITFSTGANPTAGQTTTYVLSLWNNRAEATSGAKALHTVNIRVKAAASVPKVTLSAKGSLDISRANPGTVTLTPKFSGYLGGFAHGAALAIYRKDGSSYTQVYDGSGTMPPALPSFEADFHGGAWRITAADGASLAPGTYCAGVVTGPLDGAAGAITTQPKGTNPYGNFATFKVSASKPKATVSGGATLYRADAFSEQLITVKLPAGSTPISHITLKDENAESMCYAIKDLKNGVVAIQFRQGHSYRGLPAAGAAKSTTLTLNIYLEGNSKSGPNDKPATTAKVKVTVPHALPGAVN
ncbi:hypothetical protein LJC64_01010 [Ruminococcaceae bacterium OttesenSCG-928-A11]|nr:hypothetical protein [Ruminococcaceae bacterium OttesenSCG-928-A11]